MRIAPLLTLLCLLGGCATRDDGVAADLEPGRLPPPDTTLAIAGLGPCTDNPDRRLHLAALRIESDEICRELAITSSNLFVLLHRARLRLRDCLQARWFDMAGTA